MSRGKRYNGSEHKLNIKKVIAVIIAFLVIIMFVAVFIKLMQPKAETTEKKVAMAYYSAFTNNKWGIIDSSGNTVITPGYDEMVVVPNKDKAVFIVTYDVDYTNGTYKRRERRWKSTDAKNCIGYEGRTSVGGGHAITFGMRPGFSRLPFFKAGGNACPVPELSRQCVGDGGHPTGNLEAE